MKTKQLYPILLVTFILIITYLLMEPALTGGFYFDDGPVLAPLGSDQGLKSFQHWKHFVFSGNTGPLGRPISMAFFTLDAQNWPANAYSFKQTNLVIHLINGLLVFFFAKMLISHGKHIFTSEENKYFLIPFLTMTLWLIHPIQLSTVVPIVQRMTELATFFMLIGLIVYVSKRKYLIEGDLYSRIFYTFTIVFFGILAALSKETGILLPVYILIIEITIFSSVSRQSISQAFKYWKILILYIPFSIIVIFLSYQFLKADSGYREFTIWQRFITQPEILFSYLKLLIPQIHVSGYFHDTYPFYTSLSDGYAAFYLFCLVALIIYAITIRKRLPIISFAILFFFGGHILESTSLNLELYFEHRNYLPILGIFFASSFYLAKIKSKLIKNTIIILISSILAFFTAYNSSLWGNSLILATNAVHEIPSSIRAHQTAAEEWIRLHHPEKARIHYQKLVELYPEQGIFIMQVLQTNCLLKEDSAENYQAVMNKINHAKTLMGVSVVANTIMNIISQMGCKQLTYEQLLDILTQAEKKILNSSLKANSRDAMELENIYITKANIFIKKRQIESTINNFKQALKLRPSYTVTYNLANIYIVNKKFDAAKQLIIDTRKKINNNQHFSFVDPRINKLEKLLIQLNNTKKTNEK